MAKQMKARVTLYSVRTWTVKGNSHTEIILQELDDKLIDKNRATEKMRSVIGEFSLEFKPATGETKQKKYSMSGVGKCNVSIIYAVNNEQAGKRQFVLIGTNYLTPALAHDYQDCQGRSADFEFKVTGETKEMNLDKPSEVDPTKPSEIPETERMPLLESGDRAKKKRGRPKKK